MVVEEGVVSVRALSVEFLPSKEKPELKTNPAGPMPIALLGVVEAVPL
jgi:hypothetical protein